MRNWFKKKLPIGKQNVPIKNIIITKEFALTIPWGVKIARRVDEYKRGKPFATHISISPDWVLTDGYTAYLVAKMLGHKTLQVEVE